MTKILLVNDDGVNSPGIRAALDALMDLGEVTVVAPAVQQSGVGRSISLFTPVSMSKTSIGDHEAYAVSGTPVDSVIVGIYGILKEKPDIVVSGINIGENMSCEATTSGTVGAALEAASQGIPSLAISLHAKEKIKFEQIQPDLDFALAKKVLKKAAEFLLENGLGEGVDLLNINVPESAHEPEIRITRLASRMYTTKVRERVDPRGRPYFWIDGDPIYEAEYGTDVHEVRVKNNISISPLTLDLTMHENIKDLIKLKEKLEFK